MADLLGVVTPSIAGQPTATAPTEAGESPAPTPGTVTIPLTEPRALTAVGATRAVSTPLAAGLSQPRGATVLPKGAQAVNDSPERELFGVAGDKPVDMRPDFDGKPRVYLAGAWGFPDFDASLPSYEPWSKVDASVPDSRRGFVTLQRFEQAVEALGVQATNPWTETLNDAFIGGVMFGAGDDLDGTPWSKGSLAAGTMSRETLLHYTDELMKHPHARHDRARPGAGAPMSELENFYREAVGDLIFSGNRAHVDEADVVVANLNAYRGDADDGTVWEALWALSHGKRLVVIVDEKAPKALGEGIFGTSFRHNAMLAGELRAASERGQAVIVHSLPEALAVVQRTVAKKD